MVRWPGVTQPGAVDDRHLVSGVDLLPTLLDVVGLAHPPGMDGRSFAPILRGESQADRNFIVAEYNENSGGNRHPMRTIITKDYGYLFNPWSNGTRVMATATRGTDTFRRMQALAKSDPQVAARLDLFEHRVPEELYHYASDPDALRNLIANPTHRAERDRLIGLLEAWMVRTRDPMLAVFRQRDNPAAREAYQQAVEKEAADRKAGTNKKAGKAGKRKAGKSANDDGE
jgi:N-sulfoglucosamine sulfohydrolase